MDKVIFSIVVPVYNEEEVIEESFRRLKEVMDGVGEPYELIFINDGSADSTPQKLAALAAGNPCVKYIGFSRNFGHQVAITAGMDYAKGDAIVVIDADLQDPPHVIPDMIGKWREGYHVVYGKRLVRKGETAFKKFTAKVFYRTLDALTEIKIPVDTGDFRLIDRKVCEVLKSMPERNRYVRGLISWIGFKQTSVEYVREERFAGETKYPLRKMLKLAADGITSFSYKPLKLVTNTGVAALLAIFLYYIALILLSVFTEYAITPQYYLIGAVMLLQSLVLIALGIGGEYLSRIADESKGRPYYIVMDEVGFEGDKHDKHDKHD